MISKDWHNSKCFSSTFDRSGRDMRSRQENRENKNLFVLSQYFEDLGNYICLSPPPTPTPTPSPHKMHEDQKLSIYCVHKLAHMPSASFICRWQPNMEWTRSSLCCLSSVSEVQYGKANAAIPEIFVKAGSPRGGLLNSGDGGGVRHQDFYLKSSK